MPPYEEVNDYLQKLYQIGDRLVLGFSGPLKEAYEVMELVGENMRSYSQTSNCQQSTERCRAMDQAQV